MKVLFLADLHFGARRDSITFQEYFDKFFTDILLPYVERNKIKKIIQFGDFFDNRKSTNTRTLCHLKKILIEKLAELDCKIYIIVGNHDLFYKNIIHPNNIRENLNQYKHVHVIDKITTLKFGNCNIDLVPWICDENLDEIVDYIDKSKSKICCGHFEISGFDMYKGIKNEHGHKDKFLKNYYMVYSGHYHTPSDGNNIKYLGTPYEITWSDCDDLKGFHVFDTESMTTEFILNPYKIHHKIIYSDEFKKIDIKKIDYNYYKDSFIKIIISCKNDTPHYENFIESLWKNSSPLDVTIIDSTNSFEDIDIESIETQDPLTALINSIENDLKGLANLNKSKVKQLALEIHSEALSQVYEG